MIQLRGFFILMLSVPMAYGKGHIPIGKRIYGIDSSSHGGVSIYREGRENADRAVELRDPIPVEEPTEEGGSTPQQEPIVKPADKAPSLTKQFFDFTKRSQEMLIQNRKGTATPRPSSNEKATQGKGMNSNLKKNVNKDLCNCPPESASPNLDQGKQQADSEMSKATPEARSSIVFNSVAVRGRPTSPRVPFTKESREVERLDQDHMFPYLKKLKQHTNAQEKQVRHQLP